MLVCNLARIQDPCKAQYSLYELQCPPCVRTQNTVISVATSQVRVDTVHLSKELWTRNKGKACNFLSLIIRVKLEIL